jgi:hypothetical protein
VKKITFFINLLILTSVLLLPICCSSSGGGGGAEEEYTLSVDISPASGGTVTIDPDLSFYTEGSTVSLTALANPGYTFSHWQGDLSGSSVSASLVMDSDKTVTAVFIQQNLVHTITINISDKDTGLGIDDAFIRIVEPGFIDSLSSSTYETVLQEGTYNIFLQKDGYRSKGYVINVNSDLSINAKLTTLDEKSYEYENVAGTVNTTDFSICTAIENASDIRGDLHADDGNFLLPAMCGDITISAFTKTNSELDKIVYLKGLSLLKGNPLNGLILNLPAGGTNYYGDKPVDGDLKVKLDNSFLLAVQAPVDDDFSFDIDLLGGNTVTLETVKYDNADTFFSRITGDSDENNSLSFDLALPDFSITDSGDYYTVTFNSVSGSSCYEAYVLEISQNIASVPVQLMVLNGNSLKIPKQLLDLNADSLAVYLSAVDISGYSESQMLDGTQSLDEYSYSETGKIIVSKSISKSTGDYRQNQVMTTSPVINYREKYGFDYLIMDK